MAGLRLLWVLVVMAALAGVLAGSWVFARLTGG